MRTSVFAVVGLLLGFAVASAEIPQAMGYQGRITDDSGNPVVDGTYTMRFRIYDDPAAGSLLWDSADQSVTVGSGIFTVMLGESPQPALSLAFDQDYWLLVTFDGEDQTPRRQLGSVGYAYMASGLVPGTEVSGSVTTGSRAAMKVTNTAVSAGWNYGLRGEISSTGGAGLRGDAPAATGYTHGVYGTSWSTLGGRGVYGEGSASTGFNYGVYGGTFSTSGFGVFFSGGLAGIGTKSCVVKTNQGPTLLYCQESPECWFEDFGEGRLVNGRCHIELDPLFLETVTIDEANPMKVFVELHDEWCNGVAVRKGESSFDVVERHGGASNGSFDYRVVAKRKGFEEKRLDYCEVAGRDPYLYPEVREKLFPDH